MNPECRHEWVSTTWGVIIGVSRCTHCGKTATVEDFPAPEGETVIPAERSASEQSAWALNRWSSW